MDRVLGSERYTTGTDDDHYEQIEVTQIDDEMTKTTQPETTCTTRLVHLLQTVRSIKYNGDKTLFVL